MFSRIQSRATSFLIQLRQRRCPIPGKLLATIPEFHSQYVRTLLAVNHSDDSVLTIMSQQEIARELPI